ncbi:cytochrome-c peroxidase [Arsenicibacter rosenii]|uniref:Methylamine utilization protein MauG n=1 Tax=Arsenicibacter rosenii TaxID=1750698 RepID=A0A1S2VLV6_9BACT|nr:cytochrome c peroxidase [Arsenicibacter rosenii]OIN59742.1 cytochrome-c peroxidase [Arsenicibacter rosenii]
MSSKYRLYGCLAIALALALTGWTSWRAVNTPLTPYALRFPASFGGRFTIPADNPTTEEGVYLGRLLFYDPLLSHTGTISCATCHRQERAFTDGRPKSIGVNGQPTSRNAMSLTNLLWVRQLFWDGRAGSLEEQAIMPIHHAGEMGMKPGEAARRIQHVPLYTQQFKQVFGTDSLTDTLIGKAIAQFERTLISASSRYDRYLAGKAALTEAESRGMALFMQAPDPARGIRGGNCAHCHGGPKLYQELFHNNGLDRHITDTGREAVTGMSLDRGRFRVPTLRNIALTGPYMHDGRFTTLDQVIDHYSDHVQAGPNLSRELTARQAGGLRLTAADKADLKAFLLTFTDSTFIRNPAFTRPATLSVR